MDELNPKKFKPNISVLGITRKSIKHLTNEPKSADYFSPVLEEKEENNEKNEKKLMKHYNLPNDLKEFATSFKKCNFSQRKNNSDINFLNKSSSLDRLERVNELKDDDEKKKTKFFNHFLIKNDKIDDIIINGRKSHLNNTDSPIRENIEDESKDEERKKRGTPKNKSGLGLFNSLKCDELDNDKKWIENSIEKNVKEIIEEENEEGEVVLKEKVMIKMAEEREFMRKILQGGDYISAEDKVKEIIMKEYWNIKNNNAIQETKDENEL